MDCHSELDLPMMDTDCEILKVPIPNMLCKEPTNEMNIRTLDSLELANDPDPESQPISMSILNPQNVLDQAAPITTIELTPQTNLIDLNEFSISITHKSKDNVASDGEINNTIVDENIKTTSTSTSTSISSAPVPAPAPAPASSPATSNINSKSGLHKVGYSHFGLTAEKMILVPVRFGFNNNQDQFEWVDLLQLPDDVHMVIIQKHIDYIFSLKNTAKLFCVSQLQYAQYITGLYNRNKLSIEPSEFHNRDEVKAFEAQLQQQKNQTSNRLVNGREKMKIAFPTPRDPMSLQWVDLNNRFKNSKARRSTKNGVVQPRIGMRYIEHSKQLNAYRNQSFEVMLMSTFKHLEKSICVGNSSLHLSQDSLYAQQLAFELDEQIEDPTLAELNDLKFNLIPVNFNKTYNKKVFQEYCMSFHQENCILHYIEYHEHSSSDSDYKTGSIALDLNFDKMNIESTCIRTAESVVKEIPANTGHKIKTKKKSNFKSKVIPIASTSPLPYASISKLSPIAPAQHIRRSRFGRPFTQRILQPTLSSIDAHGSQHDPIHIETSSSSSSSSSSNSSNHEQQVKDKLDHDVHDFEPHIHDETEQHVHSDNDHDHENQHELEINLNDHTDISTTNKKKRKLTNQSITAYLPVVSKSTSIMNSAVNKRCKTSRHRSNSESIPVSIVNPVSVPSSIDYKSNLAKKKETLLSDIYTTHVTYVDVLHTLSSIQSQLNTIQTSINKINATSNSSSNDHAATVAIEDVPTRTNSMNSCTSSTNTSNTSNSTSTSNTTRSSIDLNYINNALDTKWSDDMIESICSTVEKNQIIEKMKQHISTHPLFNQILTSDDYYKITVVILTLHAKYIDTRTKYEKIKKLVDDEKQLTNIIKIVQKYAPHLAVQVNENQTTSTNLMSIHQTVETLQTDL